MFSASFKSSFNGTVVKVPYDFLNAAEKKQVDCLADNIYYEALGESHQGQVAVGLVTLNRVKSDIFPDTVCGVVHQKTKHDDRIVCQFSWLCENKKDKKQTELYEAIRDVALYVYFNHHIIEDLTKGAIYYHADYVSPGWNRLQKTTKIGRHIFYIDPKVVTRYDGKS
jgi:N-acetylmuramoyl-L-alanine amidase